MKQVGLMGLEQKLAQLREKLQGLETEGRERMKEQIIRNDLHDDLRENEGAKMTMHDHDILQIRIEGLKREIAEIKKQLRQVFPNAKSGSLW